MRCLFARLSRGAPDRVTRHIKALIALPLIAFLILPAAAATAPLRLDEYSTSDDVLRWINSYRARPDPAAVPTAIRLLSQRGVLRDPDSAGVYVGFLAGILGANADTAEPLTAKVLSGLPPEDQWIVVRAIAYSGLPQWKALLREFAPRMPTHAVMIERYLADRLSTLDRVRLEPNKPAWTEKVRGMFSSAAPKHDELTFDSDPDLLDTLWGYYFATGNYQPVSRIIAMLPWSKDKDSVDRLTVGNMAKYTLVSNATRSTDLLAMLKRASRHQPKDVVPMLNEVVEAAETLESARIRKEALAAIEELKAKGPNYKRDVSFWGKVGEGTLAVGCIAAAATGQVEVALPCVIGGAASSAALQTWDSQK
jgi:hypothetical protein